MRQVGLHLVEAADLAFLLGCERTDVQLIDDQVVVRRTDERVALPVERRLVVDDGVTDGVGDLVRVRVDPVQHLFAVDDPVLVLIARPGPSTKPYQNPFPSLTSGFASSDQSLKPPVTLTSFACGAHTRKPAPAESTIEPMPSSTGLLVGADAFVADFFAPALDPVAFFDADAAAPEPLPVAFFEAFFDADAAALDSLSDAFFDPDAFAAFFARGDDVLMATNLPAAETAPAASWGVT